MKNVKMMLSDYYMAILPSPEQDKVKEDMAAAAGTTWAHVAPSYNLISYEL